MSVETLNTFHLNSCESAKNNTISIKDRLIQLIESVYCWNERQRSLRQLAQLDDRMLKDIGLSRADVEGQLDKSTWVR